MSSFFTRSGTRFNPFVTAAIVGVWLVLMGYLIRDRFTDSVASVSETFHIAAVETDDWFMIRISGAYAGFGRSRQFKKDGGWTLRDDLNISLNLQGQVKPVRVSNESEVDEDFRLISFRLKVTSGIVAFEQKGRMSGRELIVDIPQFQGGGSKKLKLAEAPRISRSLGLPVPLTGLQVGNDIRIPIFDPMDGNKWDAVIKVLEKADLEMGDKKVPAWRVRATFRAVELVMWIDDQGRLLKGQMPLGITVVRSDQSQIAREMRTVRDLPDIVSMSAVPLEGTIPEVDDLRLVRLEIHGVRDVAIPSDGFRQRLTGSEIEITREKIPAAAYSLPNHEQKMDQYLMPSRFIRSDAPEIVQKAREIIGNENDPTKAAALINTWVYKYLKKVPTPAVPDAYAVLQTRQGDCKDHAVLAAALARAVGLPAQVAVGLIYYQGMFYYHAWVTYWDGNKWFSGDPLMNRMPVPPTYVTLLYGDVDKHVNVLAFLSRLKLKVLETRTGSAQEVSFSR